MNSFLRRITRQLQFILLGFILLVAGILRLVNLSTNPPALYWDEVGLGYNAYSIFMTGKDEHSRPMPFDYFLSYRDYKPPVYVYSTVPFIAVFGLNEWAVRLPSAIAGILSVFVTFFLTKRLLRSSTFYPTHQAAVALIATFFMAISPWSIQLSRVAYEANIGQFLTTLGIYLFLLAIEKNAWRKTSYLCFSAFIFALTFYTFNANRIFTPLIVTLLLLIYRNAIFKFDKHKILTGILQLVLPLVVAASLVLPLVPHLFSKEGQLRYQEVNIFSNPAPLILSQQRIERAGDTWWANLFNNRRVLYAQEWLSGYFANFRGDFLFLSGDVNPRFSSGDVGQLYLITLPFILIGFYVAIRSLGKAGVLLFGWVLLAPFPAAFAREVPHALRLLHILPTYDILTALGVAATFASLFHYLHQHGPQTLTSRIFWLQSKTWLFGAALLTLSFQVLYFTYNYFTYYPVQYQDEWQYGYKPLARELQKIQSDYDRIVVTNAKGRAYANILFYQAFDPTLFQQTRQYKYDDLGLFEISGYTNFTFHGIDWVQEVRSISANEKVLVAGIPSEVKLGRYTKAIIPGIDGKTKFIVNEIPQGVDNATEQGIFTDLIAYNQFHQTNYQLGKEDKWIEPQYGIEE